jgi:hypothetical protein
VFFSDERNSIQQTDRITIMIVATRSLKAAMMTAFRSKEEPKEQQLNAALASPVQMLANRSLFHQFPQYFRFKTLEGRAMIYRYLTTDLHMPEIVFRRWFGEPPSDLTQGSHYEAFHSTRLFFPGVMRETRKQALLAMLEEVRGHLIAAGLGKVFSGDIRFIKQKSRAAGLYYPDTDDMRIEPDANNSKSVVYTLLHEYGHKHYHKFLNEAQHKLVAAKFYELRHAGVKYVDPTAADRQAAAKKLVPGTKLQYAGKTRKLKAIGTFEIIPSKRWGKISIAGGGATFSGNPDAFLNSDWQFVGDDPASAMSGGGIDDNFDLVSSAWFPTKYSETSYTEWYAEGFAILTLKHLHGDVGEWFAQLVR